MSRPDLQEKLLQSFIEMRSRASGITLDISYENDPHGKMFNQGRVTAFTDCIRELEKAIGEAKQ